MDNERELTEELIKLLGLTIDYYEYNPMVDDGEDYYHYKDIPIWSSDDFEPFSNDMIALELLPAIRDKLREKADCRINAVIWQMDGPGDTTLWSVFFSGYSRVVTDPMLTAAVNSTSLAEAISMAALSALRIAAKA